MYLTPYFTVMTQKINETTGKVDVSEEYYKTIKCKDVQIIKTDSFLMQ